MYKLLVIPALAAALLVGCGGDDDDPGTTPGATDEPQVTAPDTSDEREGDGETAADGDTGDAPRAEPTDILAVRAEHIAGVGIQVFLQVTSPYEGPLVLTVEQDGESNTITAQVPAGATQMGTLIPGEWQVGADAPALELTIDPEDAVAETDEANNTFAFRCTAEGGQCEVA